MLVWPVALERIRALPSKRRRASFSNRALLAMATTYSTAWA
jgi:hypothetical protein